jgi:hypothetical protein
MVSLGRKKVVCVVFFVFVISGVFLVGSVVGASVMREPSISAPEVVSVVVYNDPIWNPPTYTTNPFTGEVTEHSGTWSQNGTIEPKFPRNYTYRFTQEQVYQMPDKSNADP